MGTLRSGICVLFTVISLSSTPQARAQIVTNGSFELPPIPLGIEYSPSAVIVPNWTFYSHGGLCTQGGVTLTPSGLVGSQFAFLQQSNASMWQTITLPTNITGTYTLTYLVAGRHGATQGNVTYSVMLDSTVIILANAKTIGNDNTYSTPFTAQAVSFSAGPGNHVLMFTNSPIQLDADDMAFFDNIQIVNGAPPPQFVTNGSFELPVITSGTYAHDAEYSYQLGLNGNGWSYSTNLTGNQDGVVLSPLGFPPGFINSQSSIDGRQIAFLQNSNAATWQTVVLPTNGTYDLTYYFAGRPYLTGTVGGNATNYVMLDSTILATNTTLSGQAFSFRSVNFYATNGSHLLMFSNSATLTDDNTMFLDDVQIIPAATVTAAAYAGLQIQGSLGTNYTVAYASALPATLWTPLATVILSNNPSLFFDVTNVGIPGQRFYNCTAPAAPAQPASLGIGIYTGYTIQGVAGKNYLLQYLNPLPATTWTTITNITTPTSPYLWLDLNSHGKPTHAYYRAALLP